MFYAHADYSSAAQVVLHNILGAWYVVVPLFVICMLGIAAITYFLSRRSKPVTFTIMLTVFFVVGVATYGVAPYVSILALTMGFALVLLQALTMLRSNQR